MINVSVVLYNSDKQQVKHLLDILAPSAQVGHIYLIDNSEQSDEDYKRIYTKKTEYIFNGSNLGYGAAHNIGIKKTLKSRIGYHLVVNSDIDFDRQILEEMAEYMKKNKDVGMLMPKVLYPDGSLQYLCKLLPTPLDLIGRRFLPKKWMEKRMQRFELRDTGYNQPMNVPYLSGCFMLIRTEALRTVGLFDEQFFMYPEDIDLTRRMHRCFKTMFYPYATIVHNHQHGSYKSGKLLKIHIANMCRYFNKYGWFFDKERRQVNTEVIRQYLA